MELKQLFQRSRNLLLNPGLEFRKIREEAPRILMVNRTFVVPFALLISAFSLIGSAISNIHTPINSFIYIGLNTVIIFLLIMTHTYFSGKAITLLGKSVRSFERPGNFYALNAYAQLPFFLILAIIKMFPSMIFIAILALYTGVLLNAGSENLTKIPVRKQLQFTVLSILIMITIFIITSELYTLLYTEIIEQFSTFAVI